MDDDLRDRLDTYVRSCNSLRSCEKAAEGFVSGFRVANLREARRCQVAALAGIADWAEGVARATLKAEG